MLHRLRRSLQSVSSLCTTFPFTSSTHSIRSPQSSTVTLVVLSVPTSKCSKPKPWPKLNSPPKLVNPPGKRVLRRTTLKKETSTNQSVPSFSFTLPLADYVAPSRDFRRKISKQSCLKRAALEPRLSTHSVPTTTISSPAS